MASFVYFEDDTISREVMSIILTMVMGHKDVHIYADSADFKHKVDDLPAPPDIFFVDIHMQPCSGFEVLDVLRGDARYDKSYIVALTASVMNEEVQHLSEAGFDGVIGKPIDANEFPDLVTRILSGEKVWNPT